MKKLLLFLLIVFIAIWIALRWSKSGDQTASVAVTPSVESPGTPKAIAQAEAISGSSLNKAFPASTGDYRLTFTQEKDGFAQADLLKGSAKVATLSISDTDANPSARDKFRSSSRRIGGHPAAAVGSQGTAVLVANRYQVQARSLTPSFTEGDRSAWLERFKLDALAGLSPARR